VTFLKKYSFWIIFFTLLSVGYVSYKLHPEYFDFVLKPSQREVYERNFKNKSAEKKIWDQLYAQALIDQIELPRAYSEYIITSSNEPFSAGYLIDIAQGEKLQISIPQHSYLQEWIIEVRDLENKLLKDGKLTEGHVHLSYFPNTSTKVRVIIQATLELEQSSQLKIYKQSIWSFPVAGKSNNAILSFWGESRGGGSRSHEGNDIFAAKRNPVVAVSSGRVSSIRNKGLGGKQIWIKDQETGFSQYYAHLDGWNVESRAKVTAGDTIGFVGNTGNAKTTPPHLHFGIYKSGGAIDPKPFIWEIKTPDDSLLLPNIENPTASGFAANLRTAPNGTSEIIRDLKTEQVHILGNSDNWYHVRTANGVAGFAHKSVIVVN
jgi:murein DD-endopeptidase MepM/ murein hydrolase activator NlpD